MDYWLQVEVHRLPFLAWRDSKAIFPSTRSSKNCLYHPLGSVSLTLPRCWEIFLPNSRTRFLMYGFSWDLTHLPYQSCAFATPVGDCSSVWQTMAVIIRMMATVFLSLTFMTLTTSICYERSVLFPHKRATGAQLFELNPQQDVSVAWYIEH